MASAFLKGLIATGRWQPRQLWVSDVGLNELSRVSSFNSDINTTSDNAVVAAACRTLILAVKPHIIPIVCRQLGHHAVTTTSHLIISIAAGVTMQAISRYLDEGRAAAPLSSSSPSSSSLLSSPSVYRLIRVMPNTPALVGAMASAYFAPSTGSISPKDIERVEHLLSAVGTTVRITDESLLDAVTGLSGSGPAYVFLMIEALADGGVRSGLPRDVAMKLAAQTVYGSAKMVLETGKHPAELKDNVASPGGTTIAGIHALENGRFRCSVIDAVYAATNRSKELGAPK